MLPHVLRRPSRRLVVAALAVAAGAVQAQALPSGVELGMRADELQAVLPGLERVQRPPRLAGGLVGQWRAEPVTVAGLRFEPVFYLGGGQLRRVEWAADVRSTPDAGADAFAELVAWGRDRFGAELASSDPGSAYAAWVAGDTDVYAQRTSDPRHASVRLVYKLRRQKDASEL